MDFEALKGLLRRVAKEVEAEIKQMEEELAEARRVGAKRRAEELSAIRDILYEDKWYRIATAVFTQLKKEFAEDGKAAEVIAAAERRLFGLRLEVIEVPLLKIEAAVDQDGKITAVRCRAALDVGVEAVFEGAAPSYRLEETAQTSKTADADAAEGVKGGEEANVERGGAAVRGDAVERLLEEVGREFSGLPVYVGVEDGYVYVKRTAPMDRRQFRRYLAFSTGRADPADHLSLLHVLDQTPLAQCIYRLSDGSDGAPPRLRSWRGWGNDTPYHLHGANLGEEVKPTPRKVEGEAE